MTCKIAKSPSVHPSVCPSVPALSTFSKSEGSETTGLTLVKLGMYILSVGDNTSRKWNFEFWSLCCAARER